MSDRMKKLNLAALVVLLSFSLSFPAILYGSEISDEVIEKAGMGIGLTVGNSFFLPIKAFTVPYGILEGTLSFILTGGDTEVTGQTWRDTVEGPYWISPEVVQSGIGARPELEQQ